MEEKETMTPETETPESPKTEATPKKDKETKTRGKSKKTAALEEEIQSLTEQLAAEHDAHLRLAAEYDNFRKRTQKEKDASYQNGKADAIGKLLPIYDNLDRALQQPTTDEAFKKGVELTMNELLKIFTTLGVEVFGQVGDPFDPAYHNAVMHIDSTDFGENVLSQVFQKGMKMGDKVIRFAMVQVAN